MSRAVRWDAHPWKSLDVPGTGDRAEFAVTTLEDLGIGKYGEIDPETLAVQLEDLAEED